MPQTWKVADRDGVTRDPTHAKAKGPNSIFAPNFKELKITLDGDELDNRAVHSAFPKNDEIWLFARDEKGFVIGKNMKAEVVVVNGKVTVEGDVRGCTGCAINQRKVPGWWKNPSW